MNLQSTQSPSAKVFQQYLRDTKEPLRRARRDDQALEPELVPESLREFSLERVVSALETDSRKFDRATRRASAKKTVKAATQGYEPSVKDVLTVIADDSAASRSKSIAYLAGFGLALGVAAFGFSNLETLWGPSAVVFGGIGAGGAGYMAANHRQEGWVDSQSVSHLAKWEAHFLETEDFLQANSPN